MPNLAVVSTAHRLVKNHDTHGNIPRGSNCSIVQSCAMTEWLKSCAFAFSSSCLSLCEYTSPAECSLGETMRWCLLTLYSRLPYRWLTLTAFTRTPIPKQPSKCIQPRDDEQDCTGPRNVSVQQSLRKLKWGPGWYRSGYSPNKWLCKHLDGSTTWQDKSCGVR